MKQEYGKVFTALLAVLFGVFALIRFVADVRLAIGFLSLTFGLVAIIWTYRAMSSLSPGTSLRDYTHYFLWSLIFIMLFSVWDTLVILFQWTGAAVYPKYFLITIAYLIFVFTGYKILYLGKQFGFQPQVLKMGLKQREKKSKKKKA